MGTGGYKTAWFTADRIRDAMHELSPDPLGSVGKTVEIDETYWGGTPQGSGIV